MRCVYCGSYDTEVSQTLTSQKDFEMATRLTQISGGVKAGHTLLPLTRRKVHCKECGEYFFTVERFERSTTHSKKKFLVKTELGLLEPDGYAKYNGSEDPDEKAYMEENPDDDL